MAKKFNPDDVERWVTVKGARIPIMKDGSFGVGEMTVNLKDGKTRKVAITKEEAENLSTSKGRSLKGQYANTVKTAKEIKTSSKNARYDTSNTPQGRTAAAYANVQEAKRKWDEASEREKSTRKKLQNKYLKEKYGVTYSKITQTGKYKGKSSSQIVGEANMYVSKHPDYKSVKAESNKYMAEHAKTTSILKEEYEKYRKAGGAVNASWYRASREWDDYD